MSCGSMPGLGNYIASASAPDPKPGGQGEASPKKLSKFSGFALYLPVGGLSYQCLETMAV